MVVSSSGSATEQLALIKCGLIKKVSAFVPGDDGGSIAAVLSNFQNIGKVTKSGLHVEVDLAFDAKGVQALPQQYGRVVGGAVQKLRVHFCGKKACSGLSCKLHLGEWAYVDEDRDAAVATGMTPNDRLLLSLLAPVANNEAATPPAKGRPPMPKAEPPKSPMPGEFAIYSPPAPPPGLPVAIVEWAQDNDIPEMAELLARHRLRRVAELAALTDSDVDAICIVERCDAGTRSRFRLALMKLRKLTEERTNTEERSGWFDAGTGEELPKSLVRGAGMGGPEFVSDPESGVGFVQLPGRGFVIVRRHARAAAVPLAPQVAAGILPPPDFCEPGPLEMLAASARQLLNRSERTEGQMSDQPVQQLLNRSERTEELTMDQPAPLKTAYPRTTMSPSSAGAHAQTSFTPGGRLLVNPQQRHAPRPVALKVDKTHATAIHEEWTNSGTVKVQEAVASRSWKSLEAKEAAFDMARAVDVAEASGLVIAAEPTAEVLLRAIAANWFADRHPKEAEVAKWLKESSMSNFGVPRGMLEDARAMRKLMAKASEPE